MEETDIFQLIMDGNTAEAEKFISSCEDVNICDEDGNTPLICAAYYGKTDIISMLLAKKPALDIKNDDGMSALHIAAIGGNTEIAGMLINAGADKEIKDDRQRTPLLTAAANLRADIIRMLVAEGADKNAQDSDGNTAAALIKKAAEELASELE